MAQRVIPCRVLDDYITGDGVTIGGAGSHDEVLLELDFRAADAVWAGTTRTVTFTNALGLDPVNVLLTTNLLSEGQTEVYRVPVPVRCKAYPGWISVTVSGVEVSGDQELLRIATGDARFRVLDNVLHRWEGSEDVPASATEQLQAEIDGIKEFVQIPTEERLSDYFAAHPEIKVTNGAVTTPKIADGAVTEDKLGEDVKSVHTALSNRIQTVERNQTSPYNFKGAVADYAALEAVADPEQNDTYFVEALQCRYTWTGSDWQKSSLDESQYEDELAEAGNRITDLEKDLYSYDGDADLSGEDLKLGYLILATNGSCTDQEDAKYLSSNSYIPVTNQTVITVDSGYTMRVAHYTRRAIAGFTGMLANWDKKAKCENGFIRFTIKKDSETDLTTEDAAAIHIQVPATRKMWAHPAAELLNAADMRQWWRTVNGDGMVVDSSLYAASSLIPLGEDDAYRFRALMHTTNSNAESSRTYVVSASFYDSDGAFLSTTTLWTGSLYHAGSEAQTIAVDTRVPLVSGARFVRMKWVPKYTDFVSLAGPSAFDSMTAARTDALETQMEDLSRAPMEVLSNSSSRVAELVSVARTYRAFAQLKDENEEYYLQYGSGGVLDVADESEVKGLDCSGFVGLVLRGIPVGMTPYVRNYGGDADYIPPSPEDDIREEDLPDSSATGRLVSRNPVYAWSKDLFMWKEKVTVQSRSPYRVRAAAQIAHWYYHRGREVPLDQRLMDAEPGDVIFFSRLNADGNWHQADRFRHISHTGIIIAKADNPEFDRTKEFDATDPATYPYLHTFIHCAKTEPCIREDNLESVIATAQKAIQDDEIPVSGVRILSMVCRPNLGDDVAAGMGTPSAARFGTPGQMLTDSSYLYVGTENPGYDDSDPSSNPVIWKKIALQGMT